MTKNPKRRLKFHNILECGMPNVLCYSIKQLVAGSEHKEGDLKHVICGLSGSTIFFYITSQKAKSSEKMIELKCVLRLSLQPLYETSHFTKNSVRYYDKGKPVFM